MRLVVAMTVALVASLSVLAPEAQAKLCVRIDAPRTVRVGAPLTVRVTTLLPTWDGRRLVGLEPVRAYTDGFRLRLAVRAPGGGYREARLRRATDPAVWVTRLRLGRPGVWMLRVSGWDHAPRGCTRAVRVRVRAA